MTTTNDAHRHGSNEPTSVPSLETLALAESLSALHATSDDWPTLSAVLLAHPAADLMAASMAMLDSSAADDEDEDDGIQMGGSARTALSEGTQRALTTLFDAGTGATLPLVAETSAAYTTSDVMALAGEPGLLELARACGYDAESLAAQVMLSAEAVRWLDAVSLRREEQPEALVAHLVGALGVEREQVSAALARGNATGESAGLFGMHIATPMLTETQQRYWREALARKV